MSVIGRFQDICDEVSGGRYAVKQETSSAEQTDHVFYASICKWLKPVFPEVSDEDTNSLATAGYVYFRFLLVFDDLLDGGQAPRDMHHSLHAGLALHEASIRKLAHLFGQSSPFWPEFQAVRSCLVPQIRRRDTAGGVSRSARERPVAGLPGGRRRAVRRCSAKSQPGDVLPNSFLKRNIRKPLLERSS